MNVQLDNLQAKVDRETIADLDKESSNCLSNASMKETTGPAEKGMGKSKGESNFPRAKAAKKAIPRTFQIYEGG